MSAADYFFVLSAIYLSHDISPNWRAAFGWVCIVAGCISVVVSSK